MLGRVGTSTILAIVVWELFWKGIALWKSARNEQRYWFDTVYLRVSKREKE